MEAFGNFFQDFMKACKFEPEAGYIPVVVRVYINIQEILISHRITIYFISSVIKQFLFLFQQFLDPVYGQKDIPYTEFMAPGLIIS